MREGEREEVGSEEKDGKGRKKCVIQKIEYFCRFFSFSLWFLFFSFFSSSHFSLFIIVLYIAQFMIEKN